ncbi:MAG: hypothetical protein MZV63_15860 [Marinilabiliales bacterium]|nr:hypothetical protein [Marinilabiliales bacterium]
MLQLLSPAVVTTREELIAEIEARLAGDGVRTHQLSSSLIMRHSLSLSLSLT